MSKVLSKEQMNVWHSQPEATAAVTHLLFGDGLADLGVDAKAHTPKLCLGLCCEQKTDKRVRRGLFGGVQGTILSTLTEACMSQRAPTSTTCTKCKPGQL
jgi:hypothetical protein